MQFVKQYIFKEDKMWRRVIALFLAVLMATIPCLLNAQKATETIEQARKDAARDINGCLWMGMGFLFLYFAVGAAYVIVPNPPAQRLMGKSPEYVQVYTLAYRRQARAQQVINSLAGCVGVTALAGIALITSHVTSSHR